MDIYRDIEWSPEHFTMREFIARYKNKLPQIIQVTQGYYGNSEVETFAADQVLRIHTICSQRRVIARDCRGRYLSIPCEFPLICEVVNDHGKVIGKSRTFRDIVQCCRLPVKVKFAPEMAGIDFKIDSSTKSTHSFGIFEIQEFFNERYFKANTINGGVVHSKIIVVPLYVNISISVARGMTNGDETVWTTVQAAYTRALRHVDFSQVEGNIEITMYEDREFQRIERGDSSSGSSSRDEIYDYIEPKHYVKLNFQSKSPDADKGYTLIVPPQSVVRHVQRARRPQADVEIPVNVYETADQAEAREAKAKEMEEVERSQAPVLPPRRQPGSPPVPPMVERPWKASARAAWGRSASLSDLEGAKANATSFPSVEEESSPEPKKGMVAELAMKLASLKSTKRKPVSTSAKRPPLNKESEPLPKPPPLSKEVDLSASKQVPLRTSPTSSVETTEGAGRQNNAEPAGPRYGPSPTRESLSYEGGIYEEIPLEIPPCEKNIPRGRVEPMKSTVTEPDLRPGVDFQKPRVDTAGKGSKQYIELPKGSESYCETGDTDIYVKFTEVPRDVANLTIEQVASCLRLLKMEQHIPAFRENDVDGTLLASLEENILQEEFGMKPFHARKLMQFVQGWRPQ